MDTLIEPKKMFVTLVKKTRLTKNLNFFEGRCFLLCSETPAPAPKLGQSRNPHSTSVSTTRGPASKPGGTAELWHGYGYGSTERLKHPRSLAMFFFKLDLSTNCHLTLFFLAPLPTFALRPCGVSSRRSAAKRLSLTWLPLWQAPAFEQKKVAGGRRPLLYGMENLVVQSQHPLTSPPEGNSRSIDLRRFVSSSKPATALWVIDRPQPIVLLRQVFCLALHLPRVTITPSPPVRPRTPGSS